MYSSPSSLGEKLGAALHHYPLQSQFPLFARRLLRKLGFAKISPAPVRIFNN